MNETQRKFSICKNKFCNLNGPEFRRYCSCWKLGLNDSFVDWCPMRKAWREIGQRLNNKSWVNNNKKHWNEYQKKWRDSQHNQDKNKFTF